MNNLSGRMESIETLQDSLVRVSILMTTIGILKDQFLIGTATITNTRVTMTLMTLTIVSIPMIIVKDQLILGTVNTNRNQGYHDYDDHDERVMRHIKVEAPTFKGQLDPWIFDRWIRDMDQFFGWYNLS
jgi:hypothetical protein